MTTQLNYDKDLAGMILPFGDVVLGTACPKGVYSLRVEDILQTTAKSGLLMFVGTFRVTEPSLAAGRTIKEYFVCGKNAWNIEGKNLSASEKEYYLRVDPMAKNVDTLVRSSGFQALTKLAKATDLKVNGTLSDFIKLMTGREFKARLDVSTGNNGYENNEIKAYFPTTSPIEVGFTDAQTSTGNSSLADSNGDFTQTAATQAQVEAALDALSGDFDDDDDDL
jgi:hypothetical protein